MEKQGIDFNEAYVRLKRYVEQEKFNPFGNLEKTRTLELPLDFYERDFNRLFPDYIMGASRAISEVRKWGPQREGALNQLNTLAKTNPSDYRIAQDTWDITTGTWEKKYPVSPEFKKLTSAFMNYEVSSKIGLGTAAIPNIPQTLISTGVKAPWRFVAKGGYKYLTNADFRTAVRSSGATVKEAMQMLTGVEETIGGKVTRGIMGPFTEINRANKALAAATAKEWIPDLHRLANQSGLRQGYAQRQLKSLGIDWQKPLAETDLKKGMFRFASDTQLQADVFKEPLWMNKPYKRPLALFKRFGYRQYNLIRQEVGGEIAKGNVMPLLRVAVGGYLGGEFVNGAKNLIKKTITGESYTDEDRTILKRIADNYSAVGVTGWLSDVMRTTGADKGQNWRWQLAKNVGYTIGPVAVGEPAKLLSETLPRIAGAEEVSDVTKEVAKQFPALRLLIPSSSKRSRGGR